MVTLLLSKFLPSLGIKDICEKMKDKFVIAKVKIEDIDKKVPVGQYYRYGKDGTSARELSRSGYHEKTF